MVILVEISLCQAPVQTPSHELVVPAFNGTPKIIIDAMPRPAPNIAALKRNMLFYLIA